MSSIGKILVVVNLVLSVLVLGAAGALLNRGDATRTEVTQLQGKVTAAEQARTDAEAQFVERERTLTAEKQRLEEDKNDLEVQRDNEVRNVARLEAEAQQLRDDITKINAKLDTLESSLNGTMQRNQELTDLNGTLREEAIQAKSAASQAEQGRRDLEDDIAEANRKVQELEDQIATLSAAAAAGPMAGGGSSRAASVPVIEATIKEVNAPMGFVVLDKGRNQSVEEGYTFAVSRDGAYVGRVTANQIFNDYAVALIEEQAPNARIQMGDVASTELQQAQ
jgi:uncharacterized phage infection (PIP) family protein YhgE